MSEARSKVAEVLDKANKIVFGQDWMLESIIAALVCEGHLLIEGMPGLGKTLSVSTMSRLCDLAFRRIQFTPDLLPSDLIGTMIYNQEKEEFTTKFGPIFTQILLADEINRSPAKVQAALLEAMEEHQVTIGNTSHPLKEPFVVLATQNPIDQEGTYPLPEAQMDRFMMKININYPDFESEKNILGLDKNVVDGVEAILVPEKIKKIKEYVEGIYVDEKIKDFIVNSVQATRPESNNFPGKFKGVVVAGASPRACIWLFKLGKFMAFMDGKDFVSPEHLFKIIPSVLGHRIILTYEASIDNIKGGEVAMEIAQTLV
ncbi:MAG: AAA family ATPase [Bacteriovoracaceae bacterium]|nr:AAA family ATPase [Bacteriovoracaceae bacterium]